ncbi:MAG: PAS domain S-box protein [Deltaproteobacteria bacterium]|nr:PAS domain S-box protein [Deltaproteobacteria bacterium]
MSKPFRHLRFNLVSKLILSAGLTLLLSISTWAYFNIKYQTQKIMKDIMVGTDRLSNTIILGAHYAMMLNSREDINHIINNISKQKEIDTIRIYNKKGQIKFSNRPLELNLTTNIKAEACDVCHRKEPPLAELDLSQKTRMFYSSKGHHLLGIISPIRNETGCSSDSCHVHPEGKKILGALDVVVSLDQTDNDIAFLKNGIIALAVFAFLVTSAIIFVFVLKFVSQPIKKLIDASNLIARGEYLGNIDINQNDEMGQLFAAINKMGKKIASKQDQLKKQRDEYQNLFELVPCLITIQDPNYQLVSYNKEFEETFNPTPGDFCFRVYKKRDEKCEVCPVEKTFKDGRSYYGEETGMDKNGNTTHWLSRTSPIQDAQGNIVSVMEVCLDITRMKQLEERLEKSERKYYAIFDNIPNAVFVLDVNTLEILDCNKSVKDVYGYEKDELTHRSFLDLFPDKEKDHYAFKIMTSAYINQVKHVDKDGRMLFVAIRISPSEYLEQKVLLVTTSDITKRLEAEQQLIHAGKMATLGEMATGIAHELNQPLSVIKTAGSFCLKKIKRNEVVPEKDLYTMLEKIDRNVNRSANIISHMRQFARKSDVVLAEVKINDVLRRAFDIFSQQLKVRGIDVVWDIDQNLPTIMADPSRLEQVFINLLLNARDAIEEKWWSSEPAPGMKKIRLKTKLEGNTVVVDVKDTGIGISNDIADKIFEPFFTTKEVGKGTGLGLSISYGIIKDCHGDIKVSMNEQGETCFRITFPAKESKQ